MEESERKPPSAGPIKRLAPNAALGVDGAYAADDAAVLPDQEAVVRLAGTPVLHERPCPRPRRPFGAEVLGEEPAELGQILVADRVQAGRGHRRPAVEFEGAQM